MKNILIFLCLIASLNAYTQSYKNLSNYLAPNGINYKVGDKIKLGRGSSSNGKFIYIVSYGWNESTNSEDNMLSGSEAGSFVFIKKIKQYNLTRDTNTYFIVSLGGLTRYRLDIVNAIKTCEIDNCNKEVEKNELDKYDLLLKIKNLYDKGVLTKEEYEQEKKEILNKDF
jgi:hypothetical protein